MIFHMVHSYIPIHSVEWLLHLLVAPPSQSGWSPLQKAVYEHKTEIVTLLLDHGADIYAEGKVCLCFYVHVYLHLCVFLDIPVVLQLFTICDKTRYLVHTKSKSLPFWLLILCACNACTSERHVCAIVMQPPDLKRVRSGD